MTLCIVMMIIGAVLFCIGLILLFVLEAHWLEITFIVTGLVIFFTFLIIAAVIGENKAKADCDAAGGSYEVTGKTTTMILSGKVMVPMTTDVHSCIQRR